jgi:hypothetical protein
MLKAGFETLLPESNIRFFGIVQRLYSLRREPRHSRATLPPFITASESLMLHASCHCGAVRLEIGRKPRSLTECNCSICGRLAARWAYYSAKSVRISCKPGALQAYVYKDGTFEYNHCTTCGCVTHYRRINTSNNERIAVNSRMMAPDDIAAIKVITLNVLKASHRRS